MKRLYFFIPKLYIKLNFILFICVLFSNSNLEAFDFWNRYKAYVYYQKKDYANAAKKFEKQFLADPDALENLVNMGHILYKQEKYEDAANYFEQALKQDVKLNQLDIKQKVDLLFALGGAYAQQEKWQLALDAYNELIKLEANHARALKNIEIIKKLLEKQKEEQKNKEKSSQEQNQKQDQKKDQKEEQSQSEQQNQDKSDDSQESEDNDDKKNNQGGKQSDDKPGQDQNSGSKKPEPSQKSANNQKQDSNQLSGQNKQDKENDGSDKKPENSQKSEGDTQQQSIQQANQQRLAKLSGQEKEYLEAIEHNDQRANSYLMKMQMQGVQGQKNEDGNSW